MKRSISLDVSLYFGLPGSGKTTILTALAYKYSKMGFTVYSNIPLKINNVVFIDNDVVGKFNLSNCVILIDEATLFADSRKYMTVSDSLIKYMLYHRHFKSKVIFFAQSWNSLDIRIRNITDKVYYVYRSPFSGRWFSKTYRVPYGIMIPDKKESSDSRYGEIIQGYYKPNWLVRLLSPRYFRPRYYKYFDSYETYFLPDLPKKYKPYIQLKSCDSELPPPAEVVAFDEIL